MKKILILIVLMLFMFLGSFSVIAEQAERNYEYKQNYIIDVVRAITKYEVNSFKYRKNSITVLLSDDELIFEIITKDSEFLSIIDKQRNGLTPLDAVRYYSCTANNWTIPITLKNLLKDTQKQLIGLYWNLIKLTPAKLKQEYLKKIKILKK